METEPASAMCSVPSSVPLSQDMLHLEQIYLVEERNFPELIFALGYTADTKETTFTVTQWEMYNHPPFGYTSRVHLVVKGNKYTVNVLGNTLQSGLLQSEEDLHELCYIMSKQSP